ncbi:MAG TPA: hypothetical protein VIU11_18830 [Nakamurella sp.]
MAQTAPAWRGPCATDQAHPADPFPEVSWDLDVGDLHSWLQARRVCDQECPLLGACQRQRQEAYPTSNPRSVIWAGVAYSETGRLLDTRGLRRLHAVQRNLHRRGKPSIQPETVQVA